MNPDVAVPLEGDAPTIGRDPGSSVTARFHGQWLLPSFTIHPDEDTSPVVTPLDVSESFPVGHRKVRADILYQGNRLATKFESTEIERRDP